MRASGPRGSTHERRADSRFAAYGFPLLAPPEAIIVDCGRRGVGIETSVHLAVGSLTSVNVFSPEGEVAVVGRVCWARMVGNRLIRKDESQPVYRAGIAFLEGQSLGAWRGLVSGLLLPVRAQRQSQRPRRKVVKWRPPSSAGDRRPPPRRDA